MLLVLSMFLAAGHAQTKRRGNESPVKGRYIVLMKSSFETPLVLEAAGADRMGKHEAVNEKRNAKADKVRGFYKRFGIDENRTKIFADVVVGFSVSGVDATMLGKLKSDPNVAGVYQDFTVQFVDPIFQADPIFQSDPVFPADPIFQSDNTAPADPIFQSDPNAPADPIFQQYELDAKTRQTAAVRMAGGSTNGAAKSSGIWFLDTGIDSLHPDLNVEANPLLARSFVDGWESRTVMDYNGHGTHCAGIAAAKDDSRGVTGVSAGARVIPVKVLDSLGRGSWTDVLQGLNHVAKYSLNGDVVNISLGGYDSANSATADPAPAIMEALKNLTSKGVYVSMSAGNNRGNAIYNLPGLLNGNNIYTTAAIKSDMQFDDRYSNTGSPVDLVSVGTNVFSTWPRKGYCSKTGTSMASAVTAGALHAGNGKLVQGQTVMYGGRIYMVARWR
jgi:subtilisin family serine protease